MNNLGEIDTALNIGANKATKVAQDVLNRVRQKLGYN
jgi:tryptophanyl-tRNA synthetase